MLNIHRAYFYVFFVSVLGLFLAPHLLSFLDELCLLAFAVLAVVDMTFNRCFGKYKLMFVLLGVMVLYLAYSLVASPYNIPKAQINDFIAQCKPLIAFSVSYAIAPQFTANEKWVLKKGVYFLGVYGIFRHRRRHQRCDYLPYLLWRSDLCGLCYGLFADVV